MVAQIVVRTKPLGAAKRRRLVTTIVKMQHDAVPQRAGSGHAGDAAHRAAVEVADPYANGVVARKPDRPRVAKIRRGAGLHGCGKGHLQNRVHAKRLRPSVRIGEHVGNERPIARVADHALQRRSIGDKCSGKERCRRAPAWNTPDEFPQADLAAAQGKPETVIRRRMVEMREAKLVQALEQNRRRRDRDKTCTAGALSEFAKA